LGTEKGRKYQLTSAVGAAPSKIASVNYAQAVPYMDYVFAMSYDYYGAWDNNPGHHAGLYAGANELNAGFNGNSTVSNLMSAGVPANKLVLGVAMYGRGWKGVTGAVGGNPFYGTANGPMTGTWEPGVLDYKAIETLYLGGANGTGVNGFTYGYDTQAQAPYLWRSSTGELITFENARSAKAKGQYVQSKGLAGVFSWEIDADNGNILNAMHEGLGHTRK
jgi:chitinase